MTLRELLSALASPDLWPRTSVVVQLPDGTYAELDHVVTDLDGPVVLVTRPA